MKADLTLVEEVRNGNKQAFSELIERHQRSIMRVALRMTRDLNMAEDIAQDAFVKAYQKIDTFEGRASFKSWLYQIAVNTAKNKLRLKKREMVNIDDVHLATDEGQELRLIHMDVKEIIRNEVDQLPARQKLALNLRIFEDMSFKEIAEIMDCPYDTAKANYRHALLKLKDKLGTNNLFSYWNELDRPSSIQQRSNVAEVKS